MLVSVLAAGLWILWIAEQDTALRAPWTGLTLSASAVAFVCVGTLGRGWHAVLCAGSAAMAAALIGSLVLWPGETGGSCDPGCIAPEAVAALGATAASMLAALGIAVRRLLRSRRG